MVTGPRRTPGPPLESARGSARAELDAILAAALSRPPCYVLFSGGRDSSVILAAAAAVARREGLEAPLAFTGVHPRLPEAGEDDWQEQVIAHVGVADWQRVDFHAEFELLGPTARGALERHGPFWPPPALAMLVFGRLIGSGTIITGGGGDEIFSAWGWRRESFKALWRMRPWSRAAKWSAYNCLPFRARQRLWEGRDAVHIPWLVPDAAAALNDAYSRANRPLPSVQAELARYVGSRYYELLRATMDTFAAETGVRLLEPFYEPRFVAAFAASSPRLGWPTRAAALEAHFSDLLPDAILSRTSKAMFTGANWGEEARAFVRGWDGNGLDAALVDPERLREVWLRPRPDARSAGALHQAWLAGARS